MTEYREFNTRKALLETNSLYDSHSEAWMLYETVNKSGEDLIEYALRKNRRESDKNHSERVEDGYVFNFAKAIIDIFSFYLLEKKVVRNLPGLAEDPLWKMFLKDADLHNTDYEILIREAQKYSSVYGSIGILVNKPGGVMATSQDAIDNGIYPYYSLYSPPNIYDWQWEKDEETHRRQLVYLKLYQQNDRFLIWYRDRWELWGFPNKRDKPKLLKQGENQLGEIPFVWMVNIKDLLHPEIGISDMVDIAQIVVSIAQDLSCGQEIIKWAGFPMLREAAKPEGLDSDTEEVPVGHTAVMQFDPENPQSKPDWMPTEILEPIEAILKWIDRKTDEIYRVAHMSGVHGQRKSNNEVSSGMALRYEFTQLNTVMNAKASNQVEAELQALRLWLKWQDKEDQFGEMEIKRSTEFSIDDLAITLDNAIVSFKNVLSKRFRELMQRKIVEHSLPDISSDDFEKVLDEIETNTPEAVELITDRATGTSGLVRNANQARADHSRDDE